MIEIYGPCRNADHKDCIGTLEEGDTDINISLTCACNCHTLSRVENFVQMISRLQKDGEGDCSEHGFVEPDYFKEEYNCPHCGEIVEWFDMSSDDAIETLNGIIARAREIVQEFK